MSKMGVLVVGAVWAAFTWAADSQFTMKWGIPYYPAESYTDDYMRAFCKLNIRVPKDTNGFATVVWFHGGGLVAGARGERYQTRQDDVASISVGYRLLTNATPAQCLSDAAAAVAWTLKNIQSYGGDPRKVFLSGSSGGGYLSLMVGMDPKWLAKHGISVKDLAGLFPRTGQVSTHFTVRKVNGDKTSTYVTKVDEWAPLSYASADLPPILLQSGEPEIDIPCRAEENRLLYASLLALGHPDVEYHAYAGRRHGTMARDTWPYENDFIHRRIREIDGARFSTGPNRVRACLERGIADGVDTDVVSICSDSAYERETICVQRHGNRSDAAGDGDWLVALLEKVARLRLEADGKTLPEPGTPLEKPDAVVPWAKDTYERAIFYQVLDELGMKGTRAADGKDGVRKWQTTAEDAIRLAELIAHRGKWHRRRLLSPEAAAREFAVPYVYGGRLHAAVDGSSSVLFLVRDTSSNPAFGDMASAWRQATGF